MSYTVGVFEQKCQSDSILVNVNFLLSRHINELVILQGSTLNIFTK